MKNTLLLIAKYALLAITIIGSILIAENLNSQNSVFEKRLACYKLQDKEHEYVFYSPKLDSCLWHLNEIFNEEYFANTSDLFSEEHVNHINEISPIEFDIRLNKFLDKYRK